MMNMVEPKKRVVLIKSKEKKSTQCKATKNQKQKKKERKKKDYETIPLIINTQRQ